jgi:hypothetical protein
MACDILRAPNITCIDLKLSLPRFSSKLAVLDLAPCERTVGRETTIQSETKKEISCSSGDRFDPKLHVTDTPFQGSRCEFLPKNDRLTELSCQTLLVKNANGEICPFYSSLIAVKGQILCFLIIVIAPSILLTCNTVYFCSTHKIRTLLVINGQSTCYLTKSKLL